MVIVYIIIIVYVQRRKMTSPIEVPKTLGNKQLGICNDQSSGVFVIFMIEPNLNNDLVSFATVSGATNVICLLP